MENPSLITTSAANLTGGKSELSWHFELPQPLFLPPRHARIWCVFQL